MPEKQYRATFNTVTNVKINVKPAWYKKAVPQELQKRDQFTVAGLTEEESKEIQSQFSMKLVGMFLGCHVESVKVEEDVAG